MKPNTKEFTVGAEADKDPVSGQLHPIRSLVIGVLVGCVFFAFASRHADWHKLVQEVRSAHIGIMLVGIGCYGIYLVTRAVRWSFILAERVEKRPLPLLFRTVTWGTAANAVIPHSGEIIRSLATREQLGIPAAAILGTIAAERLFDFAMLIVLTMAVLVLNPDMPTALAQALIAICFAGVMILVALGAVGLLFDRVMTLIKIPISFLPERIKQRVLAIAHELSGGVRFALFNRHILTIIVLSLIQWLCIAACIFAAMVSVDAAAPAWVIFVILPLSVAGLTLPTAPAYLGTLQLCFVVAMTPFGVSEETALAASFSYTCIVALPVMLVAGIWYALYVIMTRKHL